MNLYKSKLFSFVFLSLVIISPIQSKKIDFSTAQYNSISFPKNFTFGCVHAKTGIQLPQQFEDETLNLIKPLGINGLNFGIEWKKLEPQEGKFDEEAIEAITQKCMRLKQEGIKSIAYLYFGDAPQWFMDKGGFEKAENIRYFVRFAKKMFGHLHEYIHLWMTFYQPAGCALEGYLRGTYAPYKKNMQLALDVLGNMLEAHVQVYQGIKGTMDSFGNRSGAMNGADQAQIGLAHHIYWLEPYHVINPFDQLASYMGNRLNNKLVIEFFKTGECKFTVPFAGKKFFFNAQVDHYNPAAPHSIDFIGLIYHSHTFMKMFKTVPNPKEVATDYELFTIYPQGLYDAIEYVSQLKVPIHVVGNGIADARDANREQFIKQHLFVVSQALKDGFDIRSYFYRVLESEPDDQRKFGLYLKDKLGNHALQPSANYFAKVIATHKKRNNIS